MRSNRVWCSLDFLAKFLHELWLTNWSAKNFLPLLIRTQLDVCMIEQFFLQDGVHICNTVRLTNDVNVVKIRLVLSMRDSLPSSLWSWEKSTKP